MTKRIGTWTQRHPSGARSRWTQVDLEVVEDGLARIDLSRVRPTGEESSPGGPMDLGPNPGPELEAAIRRAVGFALLQAKRERDSVELLRIRVPLEAANGSSVAIAVVHAVWDAVGFNGSDEQLRALDGLAGAWALFRQDDHGSRFLVERFGDREQAEAALRDFEARGHKQLYWVDRAD